MGLFDISRFECTYVSWTMYILMIIIKSEVNLNMTIYSPLIGFSGAMGILVVSATHLVLSCKLPGPMISTIKKELPRYSLFIEMGAKLAIAISDSFSATKPFGTGDFESYLKLSRFKYKTYQALLWFVGLLEYYNHPHYNQYYLLQPSTHVGT